MFTKKLYFGTDTIMRSNMGLRRYAAFSCIKWINQSTKQSIKQWA